MPFQYQVLAVSFIRVGALLHFAWKDAQPHRPAHVFYVLLLFEEAYYRKTKLFPIMHAIGIRRSLVEKYPWVAVNVYKAFIKAKALCMHELGQIGHLHATLPWPVHAYDRARQIMGEDYWPYGAHENQLPLETLARYSFQQGLSVRQVPLEEMFAKPTYELTKI